MTKALEHLSLPKDGYHFYPEEVVNLLLIALIIDEYRVAMDTEIDNAIYVFNNDGPYIKFSCTKRNVYCIYIGRDNEKQQYFFITVKGMEMQYHMLDQKQEMDI